MLEGDDEPKRSSGETQTGQEVRVAEAQADDSNLDDIPEEGHKEEEKLIKEREEGEEEESAGTETEKKSQGVEEEGEEESVETEREKKSLRVEEEGEKERKEGSEREKANDKSRNQEEGEKESHAEKEVEKEKHIEVEEERQKTERQRQERREKEEEEKERQEVCEKEEEEDKIGPEESCKGGTEEDKIKGSEESLNEEEEERVREKKEDEQKEAIKNEDIQKENKEELLVEKNRSQSQADENEECIEKQHDKKQRIEEVKKKQQEEEREDIETSETQTKDKEEDKEKEEDGNKELQQDEPQPIKEARNNTTNTTDNREEPETTTTLTITKAEAKAIAKAEEEQKDVDPEDTRQQSPVKSHISEEVSEEVEEEKQEGNVIEKCAPDTKASSTSSNKPSEQPTDNSPSTSSVIDRKAEDRSKDNCCNKKEQEEKEEEEEASEDNNKDIVGEGIVGSPAAKPKSQEEEKEEEIERENVGVVEQVVEEKEQQEVRKSAAPPEQKTSNNNNNNNKRPAAVDESSEIEAKKVKVDDQDNRKSVESLILLSKKTSGEAKPDFSEAMIDRSGQEETETAPEEIKKKMADDRGKEKEKSVSSINQGFDADDDDVKEESTTKTDIKDKQEEEKEEEEESQDQEDVEMHEVETETDNPTTTSTEKVTTEPPLKDESVASPSHDIESRVEMEEEEEEEEGGEGGGGRYIEKEKESEPEMAEENDSAEKPVESNSNDNDHTYSNSRSTEPRSCIEVATDVLGHDTKDGATDDTKGGEQISEESTGNKAESQGDDGGKLIDSNDLVQETEKAHIPEPANEEEETGKMEVEEAVEGENDDDDAEDDEANGLGSVDYDDEEDMNDEEYVPDEATNGSFSDGGSLPKCRLTRNYSCSQCSFSTLNPREHLYHLRDVHGEKMKVYECSHCTYAAKKSQKLLRHIRLVHKDKKTNQEASPSKPQPSSSRSPSKSPRSNDSNIEEVNEAEVEEEEEQESEQDGSPVKNNDKNPYACKQCPYTCRSRKLLNKHETSFHLKRRFFRCVKCNYVTHLKGRYSKHLKYHQLPILKCDFCDFRTPYRWNLERHLRNHNEECGDFKCHLCNFTAQIKQSLTVHISNHHLTSEQIREREKRRTIGISDPADFVIDEHEDEMMRQERDEHPEALLTPGCDDPDSPSMSEPPRRHHNGTNSFRVSNIDVSGQDDSQTNAEDSKDEDGEPRRKKPKIKITLKKMKVSKPKDTFQQELNERHNFEEDFIHPDDLVHRNGNVYIKNFKCQFCSFKAAFQNEIVRHEKKVHSNTGPKHVVQDKKTRKAAKLAKLRRSSSGEDMIPPMEQVPQSETKDEPEEAKSTNCLQKNSEANESTEDIVQNNRSSKDKDDSEVEKINEDKEDSVNPADEQSPESKESSPSKEAARKKNLSFFEKLQEKMPTSNVQNLVCQFCGHESKCLSESVRHQKLHLSAKNICASPSLSTRCQFCRHRCKTTDDLMSHLKLCPEARKNQITDSGRRPSAAGARLEENEDSQGSSERTESAEADLDDHEEESVKEPPQTEAPTGLPEGVVIKKEHPMENRVFVWNKFDKSEDQYKLSGDGKDRPDKRNRKNSSDSNKRKRRSESKSPVDMQGSMDYYSESPTPPSHHHYNKRVYRCPQCSFWATTASRFHVHIVGHFNRKPYNCSECGYKSNWRWDITKHIKLKTSRDTGHQKAHVVITDETGEKNYEKYDCYQTIVQLDETNAHRTEGGMAHKKGRPKRTPEKEEPPEQVTPSASPIPKPPMVTIPVMPRLQAMPRLTRAPSHSPATSQPGPMPFGPMLPGPQLMVQLAGSSSQSSNGSSSNSSPRPPPPLVLKGAVKSGASTPTSTHTPTPTANTTPTTAPNTPATATKSTADPGGNTSSRPSSPSPGGQYQIITPQVSVSSTGEDGKEVAKLVLDHEGNPEWKCNACDFRDSERDTVVQHVRLAHTRNGPVSLLHAVHRCDVCGYAAGTKRAVQLHIDSSHGGQGGITSRCEGQNPDPKESSGDGENTEHVDTSRTYHCRLCPFTCKKRNEMKPHLYYHTERPDCIFKCMFCPYYVPTRSELFDHLRVHGMEVPSSIVDTTNKSHSTSPATPQVEIGGGPKHLVCGACPFESRSRSKLMHHRQFHKPKGLPYRCPHCTYNVTRRHLLSQHMRVHGLEETLEANGSADISHTDDRSNSPSPSLTITPVTNAATTSTGGDSPFTDSSTLPKLTDKATTCLEDIPLVWVSRDHRFFKMFKCRHCPHVNLRKTNIQEHEKMHKTDISKEAGGLHCPYCSYVSVNAGVMSAHLKVHAGSMGQCHAIVDPTQSDEEQLKLLTSNRSSTALESQAAEDKTVNGKSDEKILYYCQHCPARFFLEKEIQIHSKFHSTNLPHTCDHCNYGTRQSAHLLTHVKVHTPEYQQRTRSMMAQHRTAASYPPVPGLTIPTDLPGDKHSFKEAGSSGLSQLSSSPPPASGIMPQPPPTNKYMCDQCPATFTKLVTLQYHQSLHGANNPHPCPICTYAGKTHDSLQQHTRLHNQSSQAERASSDAVNASAHKSPEVSVSLKTPQKQDKSGTASSIPPLKLKLIGPRPPAGETSSDGSRPQFKYYVEEQVPLSGVDLLRRKTQIEKDGDYEYMMRPIALTKGKGREDGEEEDPKRIGDPQLHYPLHIDKVTGKSREKRYKCSKCPSAFEKVEQYNVHTNLHGSNHKYRCRICDYTVKFFANFMMHIKRHKYHERMVAQTTGVPPPQDKDAKYEPIISKSNLVQGEKPVSISKGQTEEQTIKSVEEADLTTIERQHLLLQNKKGAGDAVKKDEEKERRVYYCQYCPYANLRRDAVDSHSLRHRANGGLGSYKCTFCDYAASQPNFIRDHTKVHFRPFKYVHAEGFMRHERQEIFSTTIPSGEKGSSKQRDGDGAASQGAPRRNIVYTYQVGSAAPSEESEGEEEENVDPEMVKSIRVDFYSGDIVEAPLDFVVSLRPKAKPVSLGQEASGDMNSSSTSVNLEAAETSVSVSVEGGSVSTSQGSQKDESMEVDEDETIVNVGRKTETLGETTTTSLVGVGGQAIESETKEDTESLQNGRIEVKHQVIKTSALKNKDNMKVLESKLCELPQPLRKNKESALSES